jgi:hypothetical protein
MGNFPLPYIGQGKKRDDAIVRGSGREGVTWKQTLELMAKGLDHYSVQCTLDHYSVQCTLDPVHCTHLLILYSKYSFVHCLVMDRRDGIRTQHPSPS